MSLGVSMDERVKWLEGRINSSLRPRTEDLKKLFAQDSNRIAIYDFVNNEEIRHLFIYNISQHNLVASHKAPDNLHRKSIFFLKIHQGKTLTNDNMDDEVMYQDCTDLPLENLDMLMREVFLPLLCMNVQTTTSDSTLTTDRLMDFLHRLMSTIEVTQGHIEGHIVLSLPSIEVLAEAATDVSRRAAVLHVLESTVIGWIKQIKHVIQHDPLADLYANFGPEPGPVDEVTMWQRHLDCIHSINEQLDSPIATDILSNLQQANSQYAHSFGSVRRDIEKSENATNTILRFLHTMKHLFDQLHTSTQPLDMIIVFKPLFSVLILVWEHSEYFHQNKILRHLLHLLSNEVVNRAKYLVGDDVLVDPLESYSKLKQALRVCAAFRGTYLDFKDKADELNGARLEEDSNLKKVQPKMSLFSGRIYGYHAYTPWYKVADASSSTSLLDNEQLWIDSPWPVRNAACFQHLNSFMERCNDVLELVETTRHFRLLETVVTVGGAGSDGLDALVREVHEHYTKATETFFSAVDSVLTVDPSQKFERAFFTFRGHIKGLEKRLAGILRQSFLQCPTVGLQLRLLEVFEGISNRTNVQNELSDKVKFIVAKYVEQLTEVRSLFNKDCDSPPLHHSMPVIISKLMWVNGLRARIQVPMDKLKHVSAFLLESDHGWSVRSQYDDAMQEFNMYEEKIIQEWKNNLEKELTDQLKQPLLIAEEYNEDVEVRPLVVYMNLDQRHLEILKEMKYMLREPFNVKMPESAKALLRNSNACNLKLMATRLETIVCNYNTVMRTITDYEKPLFDRYLNKVDQMFEQGLHEYTWSMKESNDFIETATSLVSCDLFRNLDIVQTNCKEIIDTCVSWSAGVLDVFSARDPNTSYSIDELRKIQAHLKEKLETLLVPSGKHIHQLLATSFTAVQISEASPAWRDYVDYIDAIILDGIKKSTATSLHALYTTMIASPEEGIIPILTIRLELLGNSVAFRPPLKSMWSVVSMQETIETCLTDFLARGDLIRMASRNKGSYKDLIGEDATIKELLNEITSLLQETCVACMELYDKFTGYAILWTEDVNKVFDQFLCGAVSVRINSRKGQLVLTKLSSADRVINSRLSNADRRSTILSENFSMAERVFLTPKNTCKDKIQFIPTLDEFDDEINVYRNARDEIQNMADYKDFGWLRVNLRPIKHFLIAYASRWMWQLTKYLSNQVMVLLNELELFLTRIEPDIEGVTGEERDTTTFMKMMRLFNEVSSQQLEMDGQFIAMKKTMQLLKKYEQHLPCKAQAMYDAAPGRWSNLKTKVSLAKQKLGPRIQEESVLITKDLKNFRDRMRSLEQEMEQSLMYSRDCRPTQAHRLIVEFSQKLEVIENEAQDLIELQELLETSVVNFAIVQRCRSDLTYMIQLWETAQYIAEQQDIWKKQRWQRLNTKDIRHASTEHMKIIEQLPLATHNWDIYMGMVDSIIKIQTCLPLVDDLSNPAMRTRHWKQLVRVTGGVITIDNDSMKRMLFGQLLNMGLHQHVDDVRAIVQRAVKDLSIEKSLKMYEEVWLSKIFEMKPHTRYTTDVTPENMADDQTEMSALSDITPSQVPGSTIRSQAVSHTSVSTISRQKRASIISLPASFHNVSPQDHRGKPLPLLHNTEALFMELETHQISLQAIQSSRSAGSFLDEVVKWQRSLQSIEGILHLWLEVQTKWIELEQVYSTPDVRTSIAADARAFAQLNSTFHLMMWATCEKPNVLQCCHRKNIEAILEQMMQVMHRCETALWSYIEKRRQIFPRFYFLSLQDVKQFICYGHDLEKVNLVVNKLFENVGALMYEDSTEDRDKQIYQIYGVKSSMGELLEFVKPVVCEGQIEMWLTTFVNGLKSSLKYQLEVALRLEQPLPKAMHSVVSPTMSVSRSLAKSTTEKKVKITTPKGSRADHTSTALEQANGDVPAALVVPSDTLSFSRSWTLDTITEILWLLTRIQMTTHINEGLEAADSGQPNALQETLNKVISSTNMVVGLFKDLEGSTSDTKNFTAPSNDSRRPQENFNQRPLRRKSFALNATGAEDDVEDKTRYSPSIQKATEAISHCDPRLLLFPHQINKLTTLLTLLAYNRDVIERLLGQEQHSNMTNSFEWRSQLQYRFDSDTRKLTVFCFDASFAYAYEYMGATHHEVIVPTTERAFVNLTQAINSHMSPLCVGASASNKLDVVHELSRCVGQCLYVVSCSMYTEPGILHNVIRGLASTGCWACLNDIDLLQMTVLQSVSHSLNKVREAQSCSQSSVFFDIDPVQLSSSGVCFSTINHYVPAESTDPQKLLLIKSAAGHLPDAILSSFRIVSMLEPDLNMIIEVLLLSQGFHNSRELARKITELRNICQMIIGTSAVIRDHYQIGAKCNSGIHGWSHHTIKCTVLEAGHHLQRLITQKADDGVGSVEVEERMEGVLDGTSEKLAEETAVVMSLRNTFMPRLQGRDANVFASLISDLWPDVNIALHFAGDKKCPSQTFTPIRGEMSKTKISQDGSFATLRDLLMLNTPVIRQSAEHTNFNEPQRHDTLHHIQDAIAVATADLCLLPGVTFQARVMQLSQLNMAHKSIFVVGPAGCGKSECIKTFAVGERERGKTISIQSIFTNAIQPCELMGYFNTDTGRWKDGIVASLLRKYCAKPSNLNHDFNVWPSIQIIQMDGDVNPMLTDTLQMLFDHSGTVALGSNERIVVSDTVRFIWEMENMTQLSPSILSKVGLLVMNSEDVDWKMILLQWIDRHGEDESNLLHTLCSIYVQRTMDYFSTCAQTRSYHKTYDSEIYPNYKRVIYQTKGNIIGTLCSIIETVMAPYPDLGDLEYEKYFTFACIWAFGGTLEAKFLQPFSDYWRQTFDNIKFPDGGLVFDYALDSDTHEFVRWADILPMYTGSLNKGIPADAFVSTVQNSRISYLMGMLSDAGHPVMLVGENGCGKTAIINERIRNVCSGEVAEVLPMVIPSNRLMSSALLYKRMDEILEWKHGSTYVPKSNRRLMCVIDDINLSQVDQYNNNLMTMIEMVRQHIDDGGFYDCDNHSWRYIKNVMYIMTAVPTTSCNVPKFSQRLLRHFNVFAIHQPQNDELNYIFTMLVNSHFLPAESLSTMSVNSLCSVTYNHGLPDDSLGVILQQIIKVTLDMQSHLRVLYLPTAPRCHYVFTMNNLATIFRNLCLSTNKNSSPEDILLTWEHECSWMYKHRMSSEVDQRRMHQVFSNAIKKQFIDETYIDLLLSPMRPMFSNLIEQESGAITAGLMGARNEVDEHLTDQFRPTDNWKEVASLMAKGLDEYNKVHPRITLSLYKDAVALVCRLARTFASPFPVAHTVLLIEGDCGRMSMTCKFAAHLCNFTVYSINPSAMASSRPYTVKEFKNDLVAGYIRAGVKGEKLLLLMHEQELLTDDFIVFLMEFMMDGSITHLFSMETQTNIINSIRTDVTQAGLTFSRDVAWNYFLATVRKNFRICWAISMPSTKFHRFCLEYPALTKNVNFIYLPHWNKSYLINHANYHLNEITWLSNMDRENCAHLLSMMHIAMRHSDGQELNSGQFGNITNLTFEKFVERFVSLVNMKHREVLTTHHFVTESLNQLSCDNEKAMQLKGHRDHELVVLDERKEGTVQILSLIGQNSAISAQQSNVVRAQMKKIARLKKLLPEYQVAHERAVYKAIAIVTDTKKVIQNMDMKSLLQLRSMHQPLVEVEELMAAIILILKSPTADLTWQKGGKRQIANLERFVEELMSFDDELLPVSTLELVEPFIKRSYFEPEIFVEKTNNSACGSLCTWVKGVVSYHKMMIFKVKRLHTKVEETIHAVDEAQHKMYTLENKRMSLDSRLTSLGRGFEEATIDKNEQKSKTVSMTTNLQNAKQLRRILHGERQRCQQVFDSYDQRLVAIPGGCAVAAAFITYLGAYHHDFRRLMLTVHWPNCLRDRGIPLVIDAIDVVQGRVIDWQVSGLKTVSGASSIYNFDYHDLGNSNGEGIVDVGAYTNSENVTTTSINDSIQMTGEGTANSSKAVSFVVSKDFSETTADSVTEYKEDISAEEKATSLGMETPPKEDTEQMDRIHIMKNDSTALGDTEGVSAMTYQDTVPSVSTLTTRQYNIYIESIVKLLLGDKILKEWLRLDFSHHQLENAALVCSTWQRPIMLIDPNGDGVKWYIRLNHFMNEGKIMILDMENRTDPRVVMMLENAIIMGRQVILKNCDLSLDNVLFPLIHHHINQKLGGDEEARMVLFCGRRILCHQNFRLCLATQHAKPEFDSEDASTLNIINFDQSHDTIIENLLLRTFARVRPTLYHERRAALYNIQALNVALTELGDASDYYQQLTAYVAKHTSKKLDLFTNYRNAKIEICEKIKQNEDVLSELNSLRDELFPVARRAAVLYSILRSLACLRHEYRFQLHYFISLFDEAIGGMLPNNYHDIITNNVLDEEDADTRLHTIESMYQEPLHQNSQGQLNNKDNDNDQDDRGDDGDADHGADTEAPAKMPSDVSIQQDRDIFTEEAECSSQKQKPSIFNSDTKMMQEMRRLTLGPQGDVEPIIKRPEIIPLPTEDVSYTGISANQAKQLIDKLTALFYQRIKPALLEEDTLHFASMLCLNIQADNMDCFTEEEMSLLLQGNPGLGLQLTLEDFGSHKTRPAWLPDIKWEDILALSVLPGPLDSLCVVIVENSEMWCEWYKHPMPETLALPLMHKADVSLHGVSQHDGTTQSPDLGPLTDFHQLLILRMLRPDRLPLALHNYIQRNLNLNIMEENFITMDTILRDAALHIGVLIVYPPSPSDPNFSPYIANQRRLSFPVQYLKQYAKEHGIQFESVSVVAGCEGRIMDMLTVTETTCAWLVIENIHLATDALIHDIKKRLFNVLDTKSLDDPKKHCVWMTSEPSNKLPDYFILRLHTLSSSVFDAFIPDTFLLPHPTEHFCFNPDDVMQKALTNILASVSASRWEQIQSLPLMRRSLMFGVAVIQAILVSRQIFGCDGLSQWYPWGVDSMMQAMHIIGGSMLPNKPGKDYPALDHLCQAVTQVMFKSMMVNKADYSFTESLVHHVFSGIISNPTKDIIFDSCSIPSPPVNIDASDYASWCNEALKGKNSLAAIMLSDEMKKDINDMNCMYFISRLDHMFEVMNVETINTVAHDFQPTNIHIAKLRSAIDLCMDQLPPMLDIGEASLVMKSEYNFMYYHPSDISISSRTMSTTLLPESIAFILLEECVWMNMVLQHIRQQISDMQQCLVGGPNTFKKYLKSVACVLQEELVPVSWIHPHQLPSTHSLTSWLSVMKRSHEQLYEWVRQGNVPSQSDNDNKDGSVKACGHIQPMWLGGLVNPQALFGVLKQEKAYLEKCLISQISFSCDIMDHDGVLLKEQTGGFMAHGLYLEGATWNYASNCLSSSMHDATTLPRIYIYTVGPSDMNPDHSNNKFVYDCPVYVNKSRQTHVITLPLASNEDPRKLVLSSTALYLDPGMPDEGYKKSRSYLMVHKLPPGSDNITNTSSSASHSIDINEDRQLNELGPYRDDGSQFEAASADSQLSYKPMTPQATPLPEHLALVRENQMHIEMNKQNSTGYINLSKNDVPDPAVETKNLSRPTSVTLARRKISQDARSRASNASSPMQLINVSRPDLSINMNRYLERGEVVDTQYDDLENEYLNNRSKSCSLHSLLSQKSQVSEHGETNVAPKTVKRSSKTSFVSEVMNDGCQSGGSSAKSGGIDKPIWFKEISKDADTDENRMQDDDPSTLKPSSPVCYDKEPENLEKTDNMMSLNGVHADAVMNEATTLGASIGSKQKNQEPIKLDERNKSLSPWPTADSKTEDVIVEKKLEMLSLSQRGLRSREVTPPLIQRGEAIEAGMYENRSKSRNESREATPIHGQQGEGFGEGPAILDSTWSERYIPEDFINNSLKSDVEQNFSQKATKRASPQSDEHISPSPPKNYNSDKELNLSLKSTKRASPKSDSELNSALPKRASPQTDQGLECSPLPSKDKSQKSRSRTFTPEHSTAASSNNETSRDSSLKSLHSPEPPKAPKAASIFSLDSGVNSTGPKPEVSDPESAVFNQKPDWLDTIAPVQAAANLGQNNSQRTKEREQPDWLRSRKESPVGRLTSDEHNEKSSTTKS